MSHAASSGSAGRPSGTGAIMSHRQILFVILGLMAGMFLSSLDQTVVGTAIRTIGDDLHGLALQAWVTTAYLIVSTISTPIYGKLSDIFGRRPLFLIAIVIFLVGSLLSSFSTSMYELAVFRAIQGLGAGGLMSMPLAIMGDILAPRERAKYQGYFLAVFGVSSVIGPLVGGLFAGANQILWLTGWRWVFLINLPVGLVALFMVVTFLHLPKTERHSVRIDWWGATTVIIALVPLLIVAEQGRDWGWASGGAIACYVIGGLGAIAFVIIQYVMKEDALIPLKLFNSPTFSMATILGVLIGFGMFGALLTIPLYLQIVLGLTPTESGFGMLPIILGLMIASIVSGQIISRTGKYRMFPIIGTGLMAVGFFYMTFIKSDWTVWQLLPGMFILGLGLGQLLQTLTIASQNSVGLRDMGVATSASTFFRQIGGTLGTAVIFSVVFSTVGDKITSAFSNKTLLTNALDAALNPAVANAPKNQQIMQKIYNNIVDPITKTLPPQVDLSNASVRHGVVEKLVPTLQAKLNSGSGAGGGASNSLNGDTAFLTNATHALAAPFTTGFTNAIVSAYVVALIIILIAFVLTWFFKTPPLRAKSALQEAADDAADDLEAAVSAQRAANTMGALVEPMADTAGVRTHRPGASGGERVMRDE